jgi:phage gpG-like protein
VSAPTIKQLQSSVRGGLQFESSFIPPLALVAERIATLGAKVSSFDEPLRRAVKEVVIPSIQTNFAVGGRSSWPPHAEGTIDIASNMGISLGSVLVRTGALRDAMGSEDSWAFDATSASLTMPDNVWYGAVQQGGFDGKAGGKSAKGHSFQWIAKNASQDMPVSQIPARPFAVLQPDDESKVQDIFMEWLGEKIEEAYP